MTDPLCFRVGQMVLNYIYLAQGHVKEKSPSDPAQHKPEVCAQGRGSGSKGGAGMVRSCVTARPGEGKMDVEAGGDPCRRHRVYAGVGVAPTDHASQPSLPGEASRDMGLLVYFF